MKKFRRLLTIFILLIVYIYTFSIDTIPSNMIIFEGEKLHLKTILGLTTNIEILLQEQTLQASSSLNTAKNITNTNKINLGISLFDCFLVKNVEVEVIPKTKVIPIGKTVGMKLYTDGILVVGMSEIDGKKPYENCGIQEGDRILEINNTEINSTDELIKIVNNSNGKEIEIKYQSEQEIKITKIVPAKNENGEYKLGLWVRDAAAGVGTMTFYEPSSNKFAALGHGITDVDTSKLVPIENGELVTTNIISVVKGEKGTPGEIRGTLEGCLNIGNIYTNTMYGVYGKVSGKNQMNLSTSKEIEVANRNEIEIGKATILCQLEDEKIEQYEIEIKKVLKNNDNNKSMVIKVTDENLITKTGGIIQGMSGAPIIQNNKFIGAITHVLVNDPTAGYAVFADIMIKEMKEVG